VLKPIVTIDPRELKRHCVDNMPFFAVMRTARIVDDLTRSPAGKILEANRGNREGLVPPQRVGSA
jgi:hypothetical protein